MEESKDNPSNTVENEIENKKQKEELGSAFTSSLNEDAEERKHFKAIVAAFMNYYVCDSIIYIY